jgi:rhodanese-related sulfurtransferase
VTVQWNILRSATLCALAGCALVVTAQRVSDPAYADRLKGLLDEDTPALTVDQCTGLSDAIYLDARERPEFAVSHLPGALWVGYNDFDLSRVKGIPKDRPIVVYCSVGYRSGRITDRLHKAGFTNVHNLYGGIFEWVNAGRTVVDAQGATLRVHAYDKDWGRWLCRGVKVY